MSMKVNAAISSVKDFINIINGHKVTNLEKKKFKDLLIIRCGA